MVPGVRIFLFVSTSTGNVSLVTVVLGSLILKSNFSSFNIFFSISIVVLSTKFGFSNLSSSANFSNFKLLDIGLFDTSIGISAVFGFSTAISVVETFSFGSTGTSFGISTSSFSSLDL